MLMFSIPYLSIRNMETLCSETIRPCTGLRMCVLL